MKVWAISDLHLSISTPKPMNIFGQVWDNYEEEIKQDWAEKVSEDDIVLLCGDFSWAMYLKDAVCDFDFIKPLKGKKILIRGNHDFWWNSISAVRNSLPNNCYALQNDSLKIGNFIFCGTRGWTVTESNKIQSDEDKKIYNREIIRLELALQSAKSMQKNNEMIICLIHYPPFNSQLVDSDFTKLLEKYGANKCVYGHLHGNKVRATLKLNKNNVEYFLTSCDQVKNKMTLIAE